MNRHFHCVVYAKPTGINDSLEPDADDSASSALRRFAEQPFPCSFEQVARNLASLPRMYLEPDGSFVWVSERVAARFQLDGLLVDDGKHLLSMELKGACDEAALNQLLSSVGWPTQEVVFQLVQQGVHVTEADFRELYVC